MANNKKISTTSTRSVGCTFIDWSIHFLSGQQDFYNAYTRRWLPVSNNPITPTNAHGHLKNHPAGQKKFNEYLDIFDAMPSDRFYSVYSQPLHLDSAARELGISLDNISKEYAKLTEYIFNDYNQLLETCYQRDTKLIFVATSPSTPFYFLNTRSLDRWLLKPGAVESTADLTNEFQNIFFKESIDTWTNLNLIDIWDVRERRALDLRIHNNDPDALVRNFNAPHLWINNLDLWLRGESVIQDIMNYVELKILPEQFVQWQPIYKNWQKIQVDALQFDHNYNHIVDAIINDWHYNIDLTFEQEVVIQHILIYKHNLNLKTWQLKKFPANTKDLHKLLEPNIHPIPKIY